MSPALYRHVALRRDLPERSLKRGDVSVLIDRVARPEEGEPGCVLKVFNPLGESIAAPEPEPRGVRLNRTIVAQQDREAD